ncbi:hypothetical protein GC425_06025 [Corynebacterium sp. zg254]|uniref:Low molecular weight antigen MTB12-like C-terminal domain-containing protein n=1 Tax=Corynebacterium zhongnanshanii TaxID=2768834 RepID=A0ABQ6VD09_9CORY|nr:MULTISPECIES: hypothetical protein [Corynebacterium]KAB3520805.1 hypothetical protein F8377_06045 [Corynebacterium zhongnanshanii]MCR5914423.1 hypothetical protein [Corynebacterium sp. zg254]QNP92856.1 hypothetical protein IAU67_03455 [Corynebacterium zhongnanshanii]
MKMKKAFAVSVALTTGLTLAACGSDDDSKSDNTSSSAAPSSESIPAPTTEELTNVLHRAVDPELPTEEKAATVVGGETAPEIFDSLTHMRAESGAEMRVVDPVLQIIPTQAQATVELTLPEQEPVIISDVLFVYDAEQWKLDQRWACTLIQNVMPDNVPPMCGDPVQPAPDGEAPAPAPAPEGEAPAPAPAPEGEPPAPAPAPAPAPEGEPPAPAPAP